MWFTLVSVDPTWLHACPMHGAVPPAAHQGQESAAMMHHDHGSMPSDQPADDSGHTCNCLGDCSAGTTTPLLRSAPSLPVAQLVTITSVARTLPPALRTSRHAFVLPFATAPPAHTA
ncbi:MAG: hypothetical protein U5K74_02505 [Gemmatimonadaceae bacterium]|nr:hypothetical protein [Gemmatimonadaceae bacterium]